MPSPLQPPHLLMRAPISPKRRSLAGKPLRLKEAASTLMGFGLLAACLWALAPAPALAKEDSLLQQLNRRETRLRQQEEQRRRNGPSEPTSPLAWLGGLVVFGLIAGGWFFWKLEAGHREGQRFWAEVEPDPQWQRLQMQAFLRQAHEALRRAVESPAGREARLATYFAPELLAQWAPRWGMAGLKAPEALPSDGGLFVNSGHRAERPQDDRAVAVITKPLPHRLLFDDANQDPERSTWTLRPQPGGVGWWVVRIQAGSPPEDEGWRNERPA